MGRYTGAPPANAGFTIVELLVVIVVIAILAATTIVTYGTIQHRAYNVSKTSTAATYIRALNLYAVTHNAYPPLPSSNSVCLGRQYPGGTCGGSDYPVLEDTTFHTHLESVLSSVPVASGEGVVKDGNPAVTFTGVTLSKNDSFTVDGQPRPYFIQYVLHGSNQSCSNANVMGMIGGAWGSMTVSSGEKNTFYDSKSTTCLISLNNLQ